LDSPETRISVRATDFLVNLGPLQPGLFQGEVYQGEDETPVEGDFQDVVLCLLVLFSLYSHCTNISFHLLRFSLSLHDMSIGKTYEVIFFLWKNPRPKEELRKTQ
jgi:hypothetical protein